ncbi:MAG: NfeD family protein [Burkholderiales bacterium]
MPYLFLVPFIGGLLLAVRLMFFGAERRRLKQVNTFPLRRSEPAIVAFLLMFGIAGYLMAQHGGFAPMLDVLVAAGVGIFFAAIITWLAVATARIQPEHDPEDPRFTLQGHIGVVTVAIPANGKGMIRYEASGTVVTIQARDIAHGAIAAGEEICIERLEDNIAYVERWALVEARL